MRTEPLQVALGVTGVKTFAARLGAEFAICVTFPRPIVTFAAVGFIQATGAAKTVTTKLAELPTESFTWRTSVTPVDARAPVVPGVYDPFVGGAETNVPPDPFVGIRNVYGATPPETVIVCVAVESAGLVPDRLMAGTGVSRPRQVMS